MQNRKEIIENFADLVQAEISGSIRQNIDYDVFKGYNRLLVLQSASVPILTEVLKKIYQINENMEITVIGQSKCEELPHTFHGKSIKVIHHDKAFADDDFSLMTKAADSFLPEAALFFNNFVNSPDFSNVEHLMESVCNRMPIYSYSFVQDELNDYKRLASHLHGCILYKDLVEWFKTLQF